jgi:hypothetical protein
MNLQGLAPGLTYFTLSFFFVALGVVGVFGVMLVFRCIASRNQDRRRYEAGDPRPATPRGRSGPEELDVERGLDSGVFAPVLVPVKQAIIVVQPDG